MRLGYTRVSRADQHAEQQEIALRDAGCERVFVDCVVSGSIADRPALDRLLEHLRADDVVVVAELDRFGRSLEQILDFSKVV